MISYNTGRQAFQLENIVKGCNGNYYSNKGVFKAIKWEYLDNLSTTTMVTK